MRVALAVVGAALAAGLLVPAAPRLRPAGPAAPTSETASPGWLIRRRPLWSVLAGAAGAVFVGGAVGLVAGVGLAVGAWVLIGRAEPADVRRRREAVRRDLPHVVTLFGAALRGGADPGDAVRLVAHSLPGAAADRLGQVAARLSLGSDLALVWDGLAHDSELATLGRAMARAHATGSPVVSAVERLADDLARRARAEVEDRARAVGVKAAVPLGLCLLPSFVLIGIVPLVAGLMSSLAW